MRGVTLEAKCRGVSRALGIEVEHREAFRMFLAVDPILDRAFVVNYRLPSQAENALLQLHEDVYHARGAEAWKLQEGKCCFCGKKMHHMSYEIDHVLSRGAHGRNDKQENLRVCCAGFSGCDGHRRRHGNA